MFSKNQRICLKSNPEKRGIITRDPIVVNGYNIYSVMFDDGKQSSHNEVALMPEVIVESAWDKLANNFFGDHNNYAISSTVNKIRNASANTISTLKASKTIFKPYQFIPLIKLLSSDNKRIIIADEVGLGKTIEAGHIILEFASRGNLNNFLIVCLNSIQEKWKDEMENKFNIKLKIYKSLKDFQEDIKEHKNNGTNIAGIINYDKFRSKKNLAYFEENAIAFDLIVFDEAHHLRNTTNAKAALKHFTSISKAIVMLTATPIMTSLENLYSLINLLDEKEYSKYEVFRNNININKPFIRAFNEISAGVSLTQIADDLENAQVDIVFKHGEYEEITANKLTEILKDDALMSSVLEDLRNLVDNRETRALIKQKLVNLNTLNHIYSRTRKNQVLTDGEVVKRNPTALSFEMSEQEQEIYRDVVYNYENSGIGAVQKKRTIASSFFANNYTETELLNSSIEIDYEDSKYNFLKKILKENPERIIVFSFFRKTLLYLQNRLKSDGFSVNLIYGGVKVQERNTIIDDFRDGKFRILLTSEVGSTGLDMQFCNCMVNYDLPWNPMVIEQRIGRIDRIGQQSDFINIFNLMHKDTIEEQIYKKLYDRINIFRESLGNLDEILGEQENYFEGIIEEIYKTKLSEDEINERLDNIADAVETNKVQLKKVENDLKDSFSNDAYFENEIKSIEEKRKYIQPHELKDIIDRVIKNYLTTLTFTDTDNKYIYRLEQPTEDYLFDFVEAEYDKTNFELTKIFRDFKLRNYSKIMYVTFDQEYAFKNKNVEYISAYHPLVNAISNYFDRVKTAQNTVYRFALNRNDFNNTDLTKEINEGLYFLINYKLIIRKKINSRISNVSLLKSILIDLETEEDIILGDEIAELLNSEAQNNRESFFSTDNNDFNADFADFLSTTYIQESYLRKSKLEENERLIFDSDVHRKLSQEVAEIDRRVERIQYNLENHIGLENPQLKEISDLEKRKKKLLEESADSYLEISDELVSLNFIKIYG